MSDSQSRRGAIFDLDGVLIDSFDLHHEALEVLAAELNVPVDVDFHRRRFGTRTLDTLRELLPEAPPESELLTLVARKEAIFRELAAGRLTSFPGVLELVRALRRERFQLAIGSSTIAENIDLVVDRLHIRDEFGALVSGEDVARGKPDPDIFLLAAEKMALPPWRCVVVEDAVPGVEAGKRAGSSVIAVTTSHPAKELAAADRIVDSLDVLTPDDFDDLIAEAGRKNEA